MGRCVRGRDVVPLFALFSGDQLGGLLCFKAALERLCGCAQLLFRLNAEEGEEAAWEIGRAHV